MYVDILIDGHHLSYMKSLIKSDQNEYVLVLPEKVEIFGCKQYIFKEVDFFNKKLSEYLSWLNEIYEIAKREKPDIIHFLYGDVFYKFFGIGLSKFKNFKIISTFHWVKFDVLRRISLKSIFNKIDKGVVHTEFLYKKIKELGINNITHIEYPQFNTPLLDNIEAKRYFGLKDTVPTLGCIGGTRHDKGLDILLKALNYVNSPFQLLISGKEESFNKAFIEEEIKGYSERVVLYLKYLSDEELYKSLNASDIIVLPYRRNFAGASGPLSEGVWLRKTIIGPNNSSLGDIIINNELGLSFEVEDISDLAKSINELLQNQYNWTEKAELYRKSLDPLLFREKYLEIYLEKKD